MSDSSEIVLPGLFRVLAPYLERAGASPADVKRQVLAIQRESGIADLASACHAIADDLQAAADRDFKAFHDEVVALPAEQWRAFLEAYRKLSKG
ncbi:MAG TPA: hypothetical protein VGN72_17805 [Tepidisphaeraceae bacterium]|jgi:hypothetical protein|nr:hypothetical protein [Tepidisphaeraceae bacterium]